MRTFPVSATIEIASCVNPTQKTHLGGPSCPSGLNRVFGSESTWPSSYKAGFLSTISQRSHAYSSCQAARGVRAIRSYCGRASGNPGAFPSACFRMASFRKLPLIWTHVHPQVGGMRVVFLISSLRDLESDYHLLSPRKPWFLRQYCRVPFDLGCYRAWRQRLLIFMLTNQPCPLLNLASSYDFWSLLPTGCFGFGSYRRPSGNYPACCTQGQPIDVGLKPNSVGV